MEKGNEILHVKIDQIKANPKNPRVIKDDKVNGRNGKQLSDKAEREAA